MAAKDFTALDAWQLSHELQTLIVALLQRSTLATDRLLRDRLRDAAASSPRHIAEGYGRASEVEYSQFLRFALGTLAETRNHLTDARNRGYITEDERQRGDCLARLAIGATCGLRRDPPSATRKPAGVALLAAALRGEHRLLSCWRWIRCSSRM